MRGARREGGGGSSRVARWAAHEGNGDAARSRTRVTSGTACTASVLSMSRSSMRGSSLRGGEDAFCVEYVKIIQTTTEYLTKEDHSKLSIRMKFFRFTAPRVCRVVQQAMV